MREHPQAKRQGAALRSLYHAKESFHAGLLLPLHLRSMRKMQAKAKGQRQKRATNKERLI